MFFQAVHEEKSIPALQQFIRENPLGILTTAIHSPIFPFIQSSHIPFIIDVPEDSADNNNNNGEGSDKGQHLGRLRGHIAKENPQARAMMDMLESQKISNQSQPHQLQDEVMVLFTGPHHAYVTPKWYTETKPTSGKVVPTWNYSAVQAYGKATVYYSSASEETGKFLDRQLHNLSEHSERNIMGYTGEGDKEGPWKVSDAPERYIEILKKNIIGIEIRIERLQGKYKMSQEKCRKDREGVIQGFESLGTDLGREMAQTVKERGEMKDQDQKRQ